MKTIQFTLPYPPSVNHYWHISGKRLVVCEDGMHYRAAVSSVVGAQGLRLRLAGRLAIEIEVQMPDRKRRDLDNICKALLDALQHANVIRDDEQFDLIMLRRGSTAPPYGRIGITLTLLGAQGA